MSGVVIPATFRENSLLGEARSACFVRFAGFLGVAYSQQLCYRIETCGLVFFENVATLISAFENHCEQVFSLDIDGMTIGWALPIP